MILDEETIKKLEKMGYRFAGPSKHSAVKICNWTRESLRGRNVCYKEKFYGISSHRCLQMTPSLPFCTQRCRFCWRDINITYPEWTGTVDEPEQILDDCIKAQREILQGFKGNPKVSEKKFKEAMNPNQVAISLAGEPTLYPKLPEFVDLVNSRGMTSFLVTNGTRPEMIKKLLNHQPYQLYITVAAPDEFIYKKTCQPIINDGWTRLKKSLSMLSQFNRSVIRLTLVRNLNMIKPEKYAKMIEKANPKFVEAKAYMAVGFSRERLGLSYMPQHEEIMKFAEAIEQNSSYRITDEKKESRVVLLTK